MAQIQVVSTLVPRGHHCESLETGPLAEGRGSGVIVDNYRDD